MVGIRLWTSVAGLVYLLLVGVTVVGAGFKWVSGGSAGAAEIFSFASNPLVGVLLGTLATALVQSSSTVTSVIVGLVAGGVPVSIAVPMIIGANMGTTITNTIVSLGSFGERKTFSKSFQAATVHDFFNLYSILIFLPIEVLFHPLEKTGGYLANQLVGRGDVSIGDFNIVGAATKPVANLLTDSLSMLPGSTGGYLLILIGICVIIGSVLYLGRYLRKAMTGRAKGLVENAIGGSPAKGIASGTVVTIMVQSSSTTTSLVVPLAGAGVLSTRQVFPFTMGANIGTCITALLAATAVSGETLVFALQIALVHLLYNVIGVLVFSLVPWLRDLPIKSAEALGRRTEHNRGWAFAYLFSVFFAVLGAVFGMERALNDDPQVDIQPLQEEPEFVIE